MALIQHSNIYTSSNTISIQ